MIPNPGGSSMTIRIIRAASCALLCAVFLFVGQVRAEVIEEIVAWVGGEIITLSEMQQIEEEIIAELYSRYTGEELDSQVKQARETLLQQLIDQKILYLRAARLFDLGAMEDAILDFWMSQNKIESTEELERLLGEEGLTLAKFRKRLVERYAPEEVLRAEVGNRVSVGDAEVEEYYNGNLDQFEVEAEVTLREIVILAGEGDDREALQEKAEGIRARAAAPDADFEALAGEHSQAGTKDAGGLLGTLKESDLSEKLAEAAFALPEGTISEVLDFDYGFHILKVEEKKNAYTKSLEEVREQLRTFLENKKYFESMQAFLEKARTEVEWRVNPKYQSRL
jgi:parvulin-like peptidyl-prolyl isomerase